MRVRQGRCRRGGGRIRRGASEGASEGDWETTRVGGWVGGGVGEGTWTHAHCYAPRKVARAAAYSRFRVYRLSCAHCTSRRTAEYNRDMLTPPAYTAPLRPGRAMRIHGSHGRIDDSDRWPDPSMTRIDGPDRLPQWRMTSESVDSEARRIGDWDRAIQIKPGGQFKLMTRMTVDSSS